MLLYKAIVVLLTLTILASVYTETITLANQASNFSDDDWPMFRHDTAHTGFTNSPAPVSMPKEVWSTGAMADLLTSPAIVDGIIYMTGYSLSAFNASTGETIWEQIDKGYSAPIVENGVVYTSKGAFNASTGTELWTINGQFAATVADNIYFTYIIDNESEGNLLVALNASTGDGLWNYTRGGLALTSYPAVAGDYIYLGTDNGVSAFDTYSGSWLWDFESRTVEASPTVSEGRIYVSALDNNLYCIDALTGKKIWNFTMGPHSSYPSSAAVAYDCVYIGSGDGNVYAFNASTGEKKWNYTTRLTELGYGVESSPAVANGVVYIGADDGNLYAFNASNGAKLWSYKVGDPQHLQCSPAIAYGWIYMGSQDNFLIALETQPPLPSKLSEVALIVFIIAIVSIIIGYILKRKTNRHLSVTETPLRRESMEGN